MGRSTLRGPLPRFETELDAVAKAISLAYESGNLSVGADTIPMALVADAPLAGMGEAIQMGPGEPPAEPIRNPKRLVGKPRLSSLLLNKPHLIERQWLQAVYQIADDVQVAVESLPGNERSLGYQRGETVALERQRGEALPGARRTTLRGGVATIAIDGVIIPKADLFSEMSGCVSLQSIARDFNLALDSPNVRGILLAIDSPGGSADAVEEMASMIRAGAQKKPVWAYTSALMASAAYWVGAAATKVYAGKTASLGSIGTVAIVPTGDDDGYVEIVSSQSPKKRLDPESDEGRAELQTHVDDLSSMFIEAVAGYRGVSVETVMSDFGQGGLLFGARAVKAGMADGVSSYEATLSALVAHCEQRERNQMMGAEHEEGNVLLEAEPGTVLSVERVETEAAAPSPEMAALQARIDALEREKAENLQREATAKRNTFAASIVAHAKNQGWPGADADHKAVVLALYDAADGAETSPAIVAYRRTLDAAAGQQEVGAIFQQIGVQGSESATSAIDAAHAQAGEIVAASQGKITFEQAMTQVFGRDRDLETRYAAEVAKINGKAKKQAE